MHWAIRILRGVLAIAALVVVAAPQGAQARTYKVIHDFCQDMMSCADGVYPNDVTLDGKGRLFGTTYEGGANNKGVVFVLKPNKAGGYTYKVLYDFCPAVGCADGSHPYGGLIVDGEGNVFGTAYEGGANNKGVVFALLYDGAAKAYTYKVLYSFCAQTSCADGAHPTHGRDDRRGRQPVRRRLSRRDGGRRDLQAGAEQEQDQMDLHGAAQLRRCHDLAGRQERQSVRLELWGRLTGKGTVFKLTFNKSKGTYAFRTLHNFCTEGGDCTKGAYPYGSNVPLVMLEDGSLIGTAFSGGAHDSGVVFKLTPPGGAAGAKAKWSYSVLHDFCSKGGADCTDGVSALIQIGDRGRKGQSVRHRQRAAASMITACSTSWCSTKRRAPMRYARCTNSAPRPAAPTVTISFRPAWSWTAPATFSVRRNSADPTAASSMSW